MLCKQVRREWAALGVVAEPGRCVESGVSPNAISRMSLSRTLSTADCVALNRTVELALPTRMDPPRSREIRAQIPGRPMDVGLGAAVCGVWCMIHTNAVSQESFSRRSSPFPPSSSVSLSPCFFATHPRAYHFPLQSRATPPSPRSRQ